MKRIDDLIKSRKQFKERFIYNKERFTTRNLAPGLVHGGMIIADYGSSDYKSRRGGVFVLFRKSYGNPHKMLIEYFTSESHKRSIEKRFNNGRIVPYSKPAWFNNQKV